MTISLSDAKDALEALLKKLALRARTDIEATGTEATLTISEIPFFQHGMEFKSTVRLHYTLELIEDGGVRTYWGKHDLAVADGAPTKTENASETHAELSPAIDWIAAKIKERVNTGP